MKTATLFTITALLVFTVIGQANAKVVWYADFEPDATTKAIPGPEVNNPDNWNDLVEMPDIFWDISDVGAEYPDSGRAAGEHGLIQITEGCAVSGHTELPFSPEFTDGIIDLEASWADDDTWGVTFRRTPAALTYFDIAEVLPLVNTDAWATGYMVTFGWNESQSVQLLDLADGCGVPGGCLNYRRGPDVNGPDGGPDGIPDPETSWECDWDYTDIDGGGVSKRIAGAWHGYTAIDPAFGDPPGQRGQLPMDHSIVMYLRVEVFGDSIKVWFGPKYAEDAEEIVASQAHLFPLQPDNAPNVNGTTPVNRETVEAGLVEPILDVRDTKYGSGNVGIYLESMKEGILDNITVTDADGLPAATAVDARGKLATQWGAIKSSK